MFSLCPSSNVNRDVTLSPALSIMLLIFITSVLPSPYDCAEPSVTFIVTVDPVLKVLLLGLDVTTISTIYGDMNVVRNIHLDGTNIKMLAINMKYCAYRPLVGNGINRDTGIYVGVQTLENSGVDRRVDQILTEAGMEWCCPETHAIWS